jgi:hypothetical protein
MLHIMQNLVHRNIPACENPDFPLLWVPRTGNVGLPVRHRIYKNYLMLFYFEKIPVPQT